MSICRTTLLALASTLLVYGQSGPRIFNTVKTKLAAGKQVVGGRVSIPDPDTLLRDGDVRLRFHVDRDAAQPDDVIRTLRT